jgi:phage shock protein C
MARRVYRSRRDRMLCGVLGGLAEYFNLDSALVRVIFVLIVLATGGAAGIIAYIVMCIVFPIEGTPESTPHNEAIKQNVEDIKQTAENIAGGFKAGLEGKETDRQGIRGGLVIGMILIFLGCIFMLVNFGMLRWLNWSGAGGILLIILDILLAIGIFRRRS